MILQRNLIFPKSP
jgi:serine/threonine protein kinase